MFSKFFASGVARVVIPTASRSVSNVEIVGYPATRHHVPNCVCFWTAPEAAKNFNIHMDNMVAEGRAAQWAEEIRKQKKLLDTSKMSPKATPTDSNTDSNTAV